LKQHQIIIKKDEPHSIFINTQNVENYVPVFMKKLSYRYPFSFATLLIPHWPIRKLAYLPELNGKIFTLHFIPADMKRPLRNLIAKHKKFRMVLMI
jgi:hypothetical protein